MLRDGGAPSSAPSRCAEGIAAAAAWVGCDYWPRLREMDQARLPSAHSVVMEFESAGFTTTAVDSFAQPVQPCLRAYHDVLVSRPQSKFNVLGTDELAAGLARLRHDADAQTAPREVRERYDVLVFTRQPTGGRGAS